MLLTWTYLTLRAVLLTVLVNCYTFVGQRRCQAPKKHSTMQGVSCQSHCLSTRLLHPARLCTEAANIQSHPRCIRRSSHISFCALHHSRVSCAPPQLPGPSQSSKLPQFWSYHSPHNYGAPKNYQSPQRYQAPARYGAGTSSDSSNPSSAAKPNKASSPVTVGGAGGTGGRSGGGSGGGSGGTGGGSSGDAGADGAGKRGRMQPITIAFALFVLVGGLMGYKKKRSKDSLVASSIITGLLLISAVLMGRPDTTYGVRLALVTTGSLAAYMGKGYLDKRKIFPQGVLAALSTLLTVGYMGSL